MSVKIGKGYFYKWDDWINKVEVEVFLGVIDFLKYIEFKGVDIYYILNCKMN